MTDPAPISDASYAQFAARVRESFNLARPHELMPVFCDHDEYQHEIGAADPGGPPPTGWTRAKVRRCHKCPAWTGALIPFREPGDCSPPMFVVPPPLPPYVTGWTLYTAPESAVPTATEGEQ